MRRKPVLSEMVSSAYWSSTIVEQGVSSTPRLSRTEATRRSNKVLQLPVGDSLCSRVSDSSSLSVKTAAWNLMIPNQK